MCPANDCSHCYLSSWDGQAGIGSVMNCQLLDWSVILTAVLELMVSLLLFTDEKIEFRELNL